MPITYVVIVVPCPNGITMRAGDSIVGAMLRDASKSVLQCMNVAVYNWPRYRPRKRPEATATNGSPEPRKDLNVVYIDRDEPTLGFPFYPHTIPKELIPGNVWVCCDPFKIPTVATERNRRAKSSAPSTWRSYEAAREAYEAGWHAGIGRVIVKGEGLVGVDLDDCRAGATGTDRDSTGTDRDYHPTRARDTDRDYHPTR